MVLIQLKPKSLEMVQIKRKRIVFLNSTRLRTISDGYPVCHRKSFMNSVVWQVLDPYM